MLKRKQIDIDELRKVFRLRDGNLERSHSWKHQEDTWKQVKLWANVNTTGYCQVRFNNTLSRYHAIVWILSTGKDIPQGMDIDHINGNKIDNRMENMRLVTRRENCQNKKVHRDGQLFGCAFDRRKGKYRAKIKISGKTIHLGYYDTEEEAHNIYVTACKYIEEYVDSASFREIINKEVNN